MTLIISTLTSSGIVLSADSRQTYRNNVGLTRIGSDSAMKLFKLTNKCGVAIAGKAFISEKDRQAKDVGHFIKKFVRDEKDIEILNVKQLAERLNKYLGHIFIPQQMELAKVLIASDVAAKGGVTLSFGEPVGNSLPFSYADKDGKQVTSQWFAESITIIVAGVDNDGVGRAYSALVPNEITLERNTNDCGAMWAGQTDVVMRIVKGYAPEAINLDFVKQAKLKSDTETQKEIDGMEYIINWGTISLQDAVDFCVLMTRTTENIQRFSDGTLKTPGGITGVGGHVDIAIITPEHGFKWLKKKRLKAENSELLLDDA